jgi:GT2 family glycosyltransferase
MDPNEAVVDVSVSVPTIGRSELLEECLRSLEACRPRAREIVVVDQSDADEVSAVVRKFGHIGARWVPMQERGLSHARNRGIKEARHELVAITDDDCVVAPDWLGAAHALAMDHPGAIVTGRVLPGSDEGHVPSTRVDEEPRDFTGTPHAGAFFGNNAIVPRSEVLALGGFDERFPQVSAAEDNEFGYRWLAAGHAMRFEPRLVVWHRDWRTPAEVRKLYWRYGRWQGAFYATRLLHGDPRVLRFVGWDIRYALQILWRRFIRRQRVSLAPALLPVLSMPFGLLEVRRLRRGAGPKPIV